jgi:tetraacyldisaccharide 4'-kinase
LHVPTWCSPSATDAAQARFGTDWGDSLGPLPRLAGALVPLPTGMKWRGLRVLAFAGIGQPGKFFRTLRDLGAVIIRAQALDDHQPLTETLLQRMKAEAKLRRAQLVTTEKDAVRLPPAWRREVLTVPVRLEINHAEVLDRALDRLFAGRKPASD